MTRMQFAMLVLLAGVAITFAVRNDRDVRPELPAGRREVVFWHFWGGKDRPVVEQVAARFNRSQDRHFVRAVAMPGNNLDVKFFLAVTGGDPPDVVNQDDPIVADWAHRGALTPLRELAAPAEYAALDSWLYPAAKALGQYQGEYYALCNGLDIRALYFNKTLLDRHGLEPPRTLAELDRLAETIAPPDSPDPRRRFGYLPDPRRLWAWGIVFGGRFYDEPTGRITADSPRIVEALAWMASYSRRYGPSQVEAFRQGDQALTGSSFPLFSRRYAAIMDGQWRVAEIAAVEAAARGRGEKVDQYGVAPLPPPPGGRKEAGWVNGNFFVVPRGAKNSEGAWAFMKFWSGLAGHEAEAAKTAAAGGWIPASPRVAEQPEFDRYLEKHPLFRHFVKLADSPNQVPTPSVPVGMYFYSEIVRAAENAMYRGADPAAELQAAAERVRRRLKAVQTAPPRRQ